METIHSDNGVFGWDSRGYLYYWNDGWWPVPSVGSGDRNKFMAWMRGITGQGFEDYMNKISGG